MPRFFMRSNADETAKPRLLAVVRSVGSHTADDKNYPELSDTLLCRARSASRDDAGKTVRVSVCAGTKEIWRAETVLDKEEADGVFGETFCWTAMTGTGVYRRINCVTFRQHLEQQVKLHGSASITLSIV